MIKIGIMEIVQRYYKKIILALQFRRYGPACLICHSFSYLFFHFFSFCTLLWYISTSVWLLRTLNTGQNMHFNIS